MGIRGQTFLILAALDELTGKYAIDVRRLMAVRRGTEVRGVRLHSVESRTTAKAIDRLDWCSTIVSVCQTPTAVLIYLGNTVTSCVTYFGFQNFLRLSLNAVSIFLSSI
eukprot:m.66232 g.66232  ORF g.66232 m.66232 type:complete len:109 (+) comp35367_c0_seq2:144-470(+)